MRVELSKGVLVRFPWNTSPRADVTEFASSLYNGFDSKDILSVFVPHEVECDSSSRFGTEKSTYLILNVEAKDIEAFLALVKEELGSHKGCDEFIKMVREKTAEKMKHLEEVDEMERRRRYWTCRLTKPDGPRVWSTKPIPPRRPFPDTH